MTIILNKNSKIFTNLRGLLSRLYNNIITRKLDKSKPTEKWIFCSSACFNDAIHWLMFRIVDNSFIKTVVRIVVENPSMFMMIYPKP